MNANKLKLGKSYRLDAERVRAIDIDTANGILSVKFERLNPTGGVPKFWMNQIEIESRLEEIPDYVTPSCGSCAYDGADVAYLKNKKVSTRCIDCADYSNYLRAGNADSDGDVMDVFGGRLGKGKPAVNMSLTVESSVNDVLEQIFGFRIGKDEPQINRARIMTPEDFLKSERVKYNYMKGFSDEQWEALRHWMHEYAEYVIEVNK